MKNENNNECSCGSGEIAYTIYDGYGIYLSKVCSECESRVVSRFRKDIFEAYECDEPIDDGDY